MEPKHTTSKNLKLYKSLKTLWCGKCNLHRRQTEKSPRLTILRYFILASHHPVPKYIQPCRETAWVVGTLEHCPSMPYVFLSE
jgi:hypothetical protein